jgi:plasmid replication initiation protein
MSLSPREQDLLSLMILGLKKEYDKVHFSGDESDIPTSFAFGTDELCEKFSMTRHGLYSALDSATSSVMKRFVEIKNDENKTFEKVSLCSYARFENGVLRLSVTKEAASYMIDYSKGFAEVDLELLLSFRGAYEKRILELISRFKFSDYTTSIGELCLQLGANFEAFERFDVFKNTVLVKPINNIVKKSNGVWVKKEGYPYGFELSKKGRKYQKGDNITFKMQSNQKVISLTDDIKQKVDDRYNFVDYLADRIESKSASREEAKVFLDLIKELDIKYTNDFLNDVKKII